MSDQAKSLRVRSLIDGLQKESPRLHQALLAISDDLKEIHLELNPIIAATANLMIDAFPPAAPTGLTYTFGPLTVNFSWTAVSGALFYELRSGGADWAGATYVVRTPSHNASIPALTEGGHVYRLKTVNAAGVFSEAEDYIVVDVFETPAPAVSVQVIDNNVLLSWTVPASDFQIESYNVYSAIVPAALVKFAELTGNFLARYEILAGVYQYGVAAVDAAGNIGAIGTITASVTQPPDFVITSSRELDLDAQGVTLANMYLSSTEELALGPIPLPETYQDHFTTPAWGGVNATPQNQIDAGFSLYIQEGLPTGYIQDIDYDYGGVLTAIIVNVDYVKKIFATCTDAVVTVSMDYNHGTGWHGWVNGSNQYFDEMRYLRVRLTLAAADTDTLVSIEDIVITLNTKVELDSNEIFCAATDAGGTIVDLPGVGAGDGVKTFKDVDSITLTPLTIQPITCIFDFVDIPNPTHFHIFCFDAAGRRIDATVAWKVRGIV